MDDSRLFHHRSKDHAAGRRIYATGQEEQQAASTVHYKTYPGATTIALPRPEVTCGLSDAIGARRSDHDGRVPLSLEDFGGLLGWGCGITSRRVARNGDVRDYHRAQPSAGARYPVELYVLNFKDGELPRGVWHYRVREHALEAIFNGDALDSAAAALFRYDWVGRSSAVLVMTGVFARTQDKYGERGYRYLLLEAGHIGQNIALLGAARGLGTTMLGGTNDRAVEALLDLDGVTESVIYSAVVNKPLAR